MSYTIEVDPPAQASIEALPVDALVVLAETFALLALAPWTGRSINKRNPDAPVRNLPFGRFGLVTYLVVEEERRVDVLIIAWVG